MLDMSWQGVGVRKAENACPFFPMFFLDSEILTKGSPTSMSCCRKSFKNPIWRFCNTVWWLNLHAKQVTFQDLPRPSSIRSLAMSLLYHVVYNRAPLCQKTYESPLAHHVNRIQPCQEESTGPKRCQNDYGQTQAQEYHPDRFAGLVWERNKCLA